MVQEPISVRIQIVATYILSNDADQTQRLSAVYHCRLRCGGGGGGGGVFWMGLCGLVFQTLQCRPKYVVFLYPFPNLASKLTYTQFQTHTRFCKIHTRFSDFRTDKMVKIYTLSWQNEFRDYRNSLFQTVNF